MFSSYLCEAVISENSLSATPFNSGRGGYSDGRVATRREIFSLGAEVEGMRLEAQAVFSGFLGDLLRVRFRALEFAERGIGPLERLVARFCWLRINTPFPLA